MRNRGRITRSGVRAHSCRTQDPYQSALVSGKVLGYGSDHKRQDAERVQRRLIGTYVELKRSDDKIRGLIDKALRASDDAEVSRAISELRMALKQHIQKIRDSAAARLPFHNRRETDRTNSESYQK